MPQWVTIILRMHSLSRLVLVYITKDQDDVRDILMNAYICMHVCKLGLVPKYLSPWAMSFQSKLSSF